MKGPVTLKEMVVGTGAMEKVALTEHPKGVVMVAL